MQLHPFGCNSAIHFVAVEHSVARSAVLIGPVGEILAPHKAALGMAFRRADDQYLVATEVEAGKNLPPDCLTVVVSPVVLLP